MECLLVASMIVDVESSNKRDSSYIETLLSYLECEKEVMTKLPFMIKSLIRRFNIIKHSRRLNMTLQYKIGQEIYSELRELRSKLVNARDNLINNIPKPQLEQINKIIRLARNINPASIQIRKYQIYKLEKIYKEFKDLVKPEKIIKIVSV
jgi:hypothetical protein